MDLGFRGENFSQITSRCGGINGQLDRVLATLSWRNLFPNCSFIHLNPCKSDHIPILLNYNGRDSRKGHGKAYFIFEEWWTYHDSCKEVIAEAWSASITRFPMFQVVEKFKAMKVAFLTQQHQNFKARKLKIEQVCSRLNFFLARRMIFCRNLIPFWLKGKPFSGKRLEFNG